MGACTSGIYKLRLLLRPFWGQNASHTSVIFGKQDFEIALCPHCEVHGNHMQMICAQLSVGGCSS